MAYVSPTFANFIVLYPRFAAVPEATFDAYLAKAVLKVGDTWLEKDYTTAQELYVAHLMTLEGLGTGTEAELGKEGLGGVRSLSSGSLSVNFGDAGSGKGYEGFGDLASTTYGRRFADLMRLNFPSITPAVNDEALRAHALAKDWPL